MSIKMNHPWISGYALLKRWKIDPQELVDLIVLDNLQGYTKPRVSYLPGSDPMAGKNFDRRFNDATKLYYKIKDIEEIEIKYNMGTAPQTTSEKKLRPNQRHKIAARKVAAELWSKNPDITIADMVLRDEIKDECDGNIYKRKTLRRWIKDLCPNRNPGRRPKKM